MHLVEFFCRRMSFIFHTHTCVRQKLCNGRLTNFYAQMLILLIANGLIYESFLMSKDRY